MQALFGTISHPYIEDEDSFGAKKNSNMED
jgi:hypothetical protein